MTQNIVSASVEHRGEWYKSSYSNGAGGSCVEVRHGGNAVFVRDSKDRRIDQPIIGVPASGWTSFLTSISNSPE